MLGSQALEVAIGLALMFLMFATAASAITEIVSSISKKRSNDLEAALASMLNSGDLPAGLAAVTPVEAQEVIKRATGKAKTSYMSAKSFADAATDLISKGQNIGALQSKMGTLAREARGQLDDVKAGLENWFDEAMAAAQDKYSKWASWFLFFTGLVLVVLLNASVVNVGRDLWSDAAAREAVADAASSAADVTSVCDEKGTAIEQAQCSVENISAFQLPIGWAENRRDGWNDSDAKTLGWWWLTHLFGWLLTAALLMLGAPFWFDLLGKLVNLRAGGPRPDTAANDDASYSTKVVKAPSPPPSNPQWVPNIHLVVENMAAAQRRAGQTEVLTTASFRAMAPAARVDLFQTAPPTIYSPPPMADSQNVDWLATALNLGLPMEAVVAQSAAVAND